MIVCSQDGASVYKYAEILLNSPHATHETSEAAEFYSSSRRVESTAELEQLVDGDVGDKKTAVSCGTPATSHTCC